MSAVFRLFACATLLQGERDHAALGGAVPRATLRTARGWQLVEARTSGGLVASRDGDVVGELYEVGPEVLAACDLTQGHPTLFRRREIPLADGTRAHAYVLDVEQARGLRRVRQGDWRARFSTAAPVPGALVSWAKSRRR